mgnify:CR=1 FL=1
MSDPDRLQSANDYDVVKDAAEITARFQRARDAIRSVILGESDFVDLALITLLSGGHGLIVGVPGLAKTKLGETLGLVLGLNTKRIQFTPDLMPADITGTSIFNLQKNEFTFAPGPIFADYVLADEINRAPAKTQSALLEAMQERSVTFAGQTHKLPKPFFVLATQNPIEQAGTYPLPEAQLDRFMLRIRLGYPQPVDEILILDEQKRRHPVDDIAEVFVRVLLSDKPKHQIYSSGGHAISMGDIAAIVRSYLPDAKITFEKETGGKGGSGNYLIDNSRLVSEFGVQYRPYRERVLQIINAVRADQGLDPIKG